MLTAETIKRLNELVEHSRECILKTADYIWKNPETGFREWKTSAYLAEIFKELGFKPVLMENIPGFYADLDTGRPGPALAVLGELDSVICTSHPEADPETGAVHACGHHTQCAYLVGAASVLRDPEILASLCGRIRFIAVPAEELIELEYRSSLRDEGIIKYIGGKELIHVKENYKPIFESRQAYFDFVDALYSDRELISYSGDSATLVW